MTINVRVSKTYRDVRISSDPNEQILDTEFNSFNIVKIGRGTITTTPGTPNSFRESHGLSFVPLAFGFAKPYDSEESIPPNTTFDTVGYQDTRFISIGADKNEVILTFETSIFASADTVVFVYFLFSLPL